MVYLRQQDLRALLAFLRECYEIRDFEGFVSHILAALPKVIPADLVSYSEMDPQNARSHNRINPAELALPELYRLFERHMHEHPVLAHNVRTGDGQALRMSDFCSQRQFHARGLYNEFYRAQGIEDQVCFTIPCKPPRVIGIALHRSRWDFPDRGRLLANLLRPHLAQAWRNAKIITRMQQELKVLRAVLEDSNQGVIILDSRRQTPLVTPRALAYLREYFPRAPGQEGALPDHLQRWIRHQEKLIRGSDAPPPRLPLVVERDGRRLVVRLLAEDVRSIILLEERTTAPQSARLCALGLTCREAEVLNWVAQGKSNADIAAILSISPRTVQKHLEKVFQKLGVETRTAAAVFCLRTA